MALRKMFETAAPAASLALVSLAAPAVARDGPAPPVRSGHAEHALAGAGHAPSPEMRASWLAECRDRLADTDMRRNAAERCEAYFDDYYARYRVSQPGPAGGYPVAGWSGCCRQPVTIAAPPMRRDAPKCTETVEYEYVDVPVRAAPRRAPRAVPDKRIYMK